MNTIMLFEQSAANAVCVFFTLNRSFYPSYAIAVAVEE